MLLVSAFRPISGNITYYNVDCGIGDVKEMSSHETEGTTIFGVFVVK